MHAERADGMVPHIHTRGTGQTTYSSAVYTAVAKQQVGDYLDIELVALAHDEQPCDDVASGNEVKVATQ